MDVHTFQLIWACSSAVEHCPCMEAFKKSFIKTRKGRGLGFENDFGLKQPLSSKSPDGSIANFKKI